MENVGELSVEQLEHVNQLVEEFLRKQKQNRKGARVFCVACGAGKRTPLRRWHNSYLCCNCWKIMKKVGEESFIRALKGEEDD